MKRFNIILAIVILVAIVAINFFIIIGNFGPNMANASSCDGPRDPHFHLDDWTVCMNQLPKACGSN